MKNAVILHGTSFDPNTKTSQSNWFPWLKTELEKLGYLVWLPELPNAQKPNMETYQKFLLSNPHWTFDQDSILIGHSSGSVAILGLLQALPEHTKVRACFLVGSFKDDLGKDFLKELFLKPLDFKKIKPKAQKFIFIHSNNDPRCPLEGAQYVAKQLNGKLIVIPGQYHFSVGTAGPRYKEFPKLLEIIKEHTIKPEV